MIALHPRPEERPDALLEAWGGEVFRGVRLLGERAHSDATVAFALLHRDYGVALIDLAPDEVPDAVARFRSAYRAADPTGPGPPPVVYRSLSGADFWRLTILLDSAFALEPPPAPGGDAWVARAREVLARVPDEPVRVPEAVVGLPGVPALLAAAPDEASASEMAEAVKPSGARHPVSWLVLLLALVGGAVLLGRSGVPGSSWVATGPARDAGMPVLPAMSGVNPAAPAPPGKTEAASVPVLAEAERSAPSLPAKDDAGMAAEGEDGAPGTPPPVFAPAPPLRVGEATLAPAPHLPGPALPEAEPSLPRPVPPLAEMPQPVEEAYPAPPGLVAESPPLLLLAEAVLGLPPGDPVPLATGPAPPLAVSWLPGPVPARPPRLPEMADPPLPVNLPWPDAPPVAELAEVPEAPAPVAAPAAPSAMAALTPEEEVRAVSGPSPAPAPPAEPAQLPAPVMAAPALSPELLQAMVRRGNAMLAIGDVSAARLLLERAASAGSGPAATAMGRTHDPAFLAGLGVRGLRPDPALAASWYRRAVALGDGEAGVLLQRLLPGSRGRVAE